MPFGLTNAVVVFQHMENDIFRDYLDIFTIVYLDDILIYSKSQEEHDLHVCQEEHDAKLEKCAFDKSQVEFLGYVISQDGISMDLSKVQAVLDWQTPSSVRDILCFLGFANSHRKFIQNYSKIIMPLTELTKKNMTFT